MGNHQDRCLEFLEGKPSPLEYAEFLWGEIAGQELDREELEFALLDVLVQEWALSTGLDPKRCLGLLRHAERGCDAADMIIQLGLYPLSAVHYGLSCALVLDDPVRISRFLVAFERSSLFLKEMADDPRDRETFQSIISAALIGYCATDRFSEGRAVMAEFKQFAPTHALGLEEYRERVCARLTAAEALEVRSFLMGDRTSS